MAWDLWSSVSEGQAGPGTSVIAVRVGDRFALFVADRLGGVFTASGNAQRGWSRWTPVSDGRAGPGTSVTAVPVGDRFALFVADPFGGVFTASGNAERGWSRWTSVSQGQAGPGVSVTAVPISGDRFALFLADPHGGVYTASGNVGRWSGWSPVSEGQAGPRTSVTAVPIRGDRFALFLADPHGGVYTASGNVGRWSGWSPVSEGQAGPRTSVTAVPIGGDRFALFLADPHGGVYTASGFAERWGPWSSVSEGQAGPGTSVSAVPIAGGRYALFVADPGGGVFTTSGTADRAWDLWSSVSQGRAGAGTAVTAVPIGGDRAALFVADPRGGVFTTSGDSSTLIKHVFVLMLENRSFDHMLGFSGIEGTDASTGERTRIEGLIGIDGRIGLGFKNEFKHITYPVSDGAADVIAPGPRHDFPDVLEQLCGPGVEYTKGDPYPSPAAEKCNSGFVSSYAKTKAERVGDVMKCFSEENLPVLHQLAREFVVCDHWFSSIPGPTEPNRYFMHAGTCGPFDYSPTPVEILQAMGILGLAGELPDKALKLSLLLGGPEGDLILAIPGVGPTPGGGFKFKHGTIFKQLEKAGVQYRIYADDPFPVVAELDGVSVRRDIREFEDFAKDLRDPSFNAGFVHIEPNYQADDDFVGGNSQHPNGSVAAGEKFIKATYEAIRNSPVWEKSLLIITWDEHGGFYDHVFPPEAPRTGERGRDFDFRFDRLGPRVPAVVVSPLIRKNLIEHKVFDHTAIAATLRRVFKLPPLGERDGMSGGVDHLAGFTIRTDAPVELKEVAIAEAAASAPAPPFSKSAALRPDALLSDNPPGLLAQVLHSAVAQHLEVASPERRAAILARVRLLRTYADVLAYLKEVEQFVRGTRAKAGFGH